MFSGFLAAVMVVAVDDGGDQWWFVMKDDGGDKKVNVRGDISVRVRSWTMRPAATMRGNAMDCLRRKWREERDERKKTMRGRWERAELAQTYFLYIKLCATWGCIRDVLPYEIVYV